MNRRTAMLLMLMLFFCSASIAQSFKEVTVRGDTSMYYYSRNVVNYLNEKCFFLKINQQQQIFEITLYPDADKNIVSIQLLPSSDIVVIDSITNISGKYFRGKLKFQNSNQTSLRFNINTKNGKYVEEMKLLLYSETSLSPDNSPVDLYAGEEKIIEIPAINPSNLQISSDWIRAGDFDYFLTADENSLNIHVHPNNTGNKELILSLKTKTPFINTSNQLSYTLKYFTIHFTVKPSRLNFINTDKSDFFFDNSMEDGEELQLDQKKGLEAGKIYRIENKLEPGGKLVAELYVKSQIGDSKMLCSLRPYSYHKVSEGYLYIKLTNEPKYITNFNVLQKPTIESISVLHEGEDWSPLGVVHPGENVQIKIEGKGLAKTKFQFYNCSNIKQDSTRIFDDVAFYSFTVPADINKKIIYVELNKRRTKYELAVKENQHPKDFNFVMVNYGFQNIPLTSAMFNKPVVEPRSLNDINISFNRSLIDEKDELFGKQYLDFEFKLYNSKNDLIEDQKLENIAICPGDGSYRGGFYDRKDCFKSTINVNDYLLHKTYDLEGWSKIEISVKHSINKYSEPGYSRRIVIIKQKLTSIDLQASFPAGLLVKRFSSNGVGELSGLSIAFLAQVSFYEKDGIEKLKPYKVGAGFIALNVFNLTSSSSQPDIGAVVIASVLPLKAKSKFNFPLYFGFGYMLKSSDWFTLLGPGVQFNF